MTNDQSDRLDMYQAIIRFIEVDEVIISATRAGLIAGKDQLKLLVTDITNAGGKQTTASKGAYDDKGEKKEALVMQLYVVTSGTKGFAGSTNDNTLQEQMNYSLSELRKLGDESISGFTTNIANLITPHLGAPLTAFGVDAAAMTALTAAQVAYDGDKSKGRSATTFVAANTSALPPLFTKASKIVKEIMDPVAATLRPTQAVWFDRYTNARKIINTGAGTTAFSGDITETITNTPIFDAMVSITETGLPDIVIKSDVNGHYKQVPIKRGVKQVVVTHPLYIDVVINAFEIKQGQTVTKNVVMEKKP